MNDETREQTNPFKTFQACNWEEDYAYENGNYINTCIECKLSFRGHKRRVICKVCAGPNWEELAKKQAPPDNKCAHAGCWAEGEMVGFARCMVKKVPQAYEAGRKAGIEEAIEAINKRSELVDPIFIMAHRSIIMELEALKTEKP